MWSILYDGRARLSFTIPAGHHQHRRAAYHSHLVSRLRLIYLRLHVYLHCMVNKVVPVLKWLSMCVEVKM
jgi:hypothetical protein